MEVREAGDGAAAGEYFKPPPKKYSWAEVRQAVQDLRKDLASRTTLSPMAVTVRRLSNGRFRIYFLRNPLNGWEMTLLYTDITPSTQPNTSVLEWKPLIESNIALNVTTNKWSREEQLLWERQRVSAWGIASYELHMATGRVLFPCASSLFVADEEDNQSPPLIPRALTTGGGAPLTPAMCPHSPTLVAHASKGDIWLAGGGLRRPTRLTYACKGHEPDRLSDDPKQAGVPSYVTQEEFSRYTGFWWQPKTNDDTYRIVYEEVDESDVKIFSFPSSQSSTGDVEEFRFPRAGTANAKSILKMVTFKLRKTSSSTVLDYYNEGQDGHLQESSKESMEVVDIRWYGLREPLKDSFPWFEYLARVGWTPCGKYVWVQVLDRKQQRLELVLIGTQEFCVPYHYEGAQPTCAMDDDLPPTASKKIHVLVSETAPEAWINVHDVIHFLPSSPGLPDRISFIWASESTGYMHLYLITSELRDSEITAMEMVNESNASGPHILTREAITAGEWEIISKKIWVDESRGLVYLVGLRETPLERHLYVAPYNPPRPHALTLLTNRGYSCTVDMDEECTYVVVTSSNITTVPSSKVYRIVHTPSLAMEPQGTLMEKNADEIASRVYNGTWDGRPDDDDCSESALLVRERTLTSYSVPPPALYSCRLSCGARAYCSLWRRAGGAGRGPTVLHVYGGPEVQTVTNTYKGIRQLRMHMLAARGFNVVCVDSRGSKHRGRAWEACIRGKMGQLELDDQVEVLQWLAKETDCIDMERVAIHGWSYGGYLSLLGLATRPNIFKLCVSGAPVTCWRLYDTAYTERYMGAPSHAYTRASVLAHAPFFPDQEGRLLIIHGLADENVHFCHTAALLSELVRLGKPHRVQIYPGERHSLRAMHAAKHYEATLLHFLHENL